MIEQGNKIEASDSTRGGAKLGELLSGSHQEEQVLAAPPSLPNSPTLGAPQSPTAEHFHSPFENVTSIKVTTNHPVNFINADRACKVKVQTAVALSDFDDTAAKGSGEHAHDGHGARFSLGLSSLLVECDRKRSFLTREHYEELEKSGGTRIFPVNIWQNHYRPCTGRPELDVMKAMLQRAQLLCMGVHELRLEDFIDHLNLVHEKHMGALLANVTLDESVVELARTIKSKGGKTAICSASGNGFLDPAVVHLMNGQQNVSATFSAVFGGVAKKVQFGNYTGEGISECCQKLGVDPRKAIMLGDTCSDVAAGIAGVPLIFIRPPDHETSESDEARARAICQKMQDLQTNVHGAKSFSSTAATVIQLHSFSQISLEYCPDISQSRFEIL